MADLDAAIRPYVDSGAAGLDLPRRLDHQAADRGTGTAAYVDPQHDTVSVVLTQVELGGPDPAGVLEAFWTAATP